MKPTLSQACSLAVMLALMATTPLAAAPFHFDVTTDPHMGTTNRALALAPDKTHFNPTYRDRTLQRIRTRPAGPGAFMVVCGDLDDFDSVRQAIAEVIALPRQAQGAAYPFYPVVGNHDVYSTGNFSADTDGWRTRQLVAYNRRHLPNVVNWGPEIPSRLPGYGDDGIRFTTYSFDHENAHFVVLDQYGKNDYMPAEGRFPARGNAHLFKPLLTWLARDLAETRKQHIFVFGHQGMTGKWALKEDSGAGTFWSLLAKYPVRAYFHGHEHAYALSTEQPYSVICVGHLRDTVTVHVDGDNVRSESYIHAAALTVTNFLAGLGVKAANQPWIRPLDRVTFSE